MTLITKLIIFEGFAENKVTIIFLCQKA